MGTLNIRCRTILGSQKGAIILTTTHIILHYLTEEQFSGQGTQQQLRLLEFLARQYLPPCRLNFKEDADARWPAGNSVFCCLGLPLADMSTLPSPSLPAVKQAS